MTELPTRLNQNSQSSFHGRGDQSGHPHSTGSSKIFAKAMARPQNAVIPDKYNFPSLGLKIMNKEKIVFDSSNPFRVHDNDEMLLLAQENKRRIKELDDKQRTHISLKPIATRTDRKGRIAEIKAIKPLPRKPSFKEEELRQDLIQGKKKEADVMMNLTSVRRGVSEDGLALVPSAGEKINLFDHPDISIDELKAIEAVHAGIEEEDEEGQPSRASEGMRKKRGNNLNYLKQGMKRESTREYVMQIRKIFMTGFAIENKKEETRNLEDYIKSEEDKLANAKTVFKEDQEKFDKYHMNLKQQASKMSKDLEKELKRKMQKLTDIQELREEIKLIEVDINKKKQEFEDLQACRTFLIKLRGPQGPPQSVSLTRSQMSSRHPLSRVQHGQSLHSKRKESTISTYSKQRQLAQASEAAIESSVFLTGMKQATSGSLERASEFSRQKQREQMSPSPGPVSTGVMGEKLTEEEAKYYLDSDDDHAVPFEDPKELLEIVQEMEEKNLFLIDIEQNNENTLEKMVRNYEGELKIVKKQHTEIKNNVRSLEEKLKIMRLREDKLKREIKTLQNGGTGNQTQQSPRRGGAANSRGQSSLGNNELVLSSTEHVDRIRKEVQDVYKLCEKNPNNQATLLEMLKTIELHVQTMLMQREYMMKKEGGVQFVTKREEEFKYNRRLDKAKQYKRIEEEKTREREKKLEKKKEQKRVVFRGHKDVNRTKPVERKQKESSQNKGNKQQEEIVKYLELNTATETGRSLMETLLASTSHVVEQNRSVEAFKIKKDRRELSHTRLSQGGTQRNVDSRGTKGMSEASSKRI